MVACSDGVAGFFSKSQSRGSWRGRPKDRFDTCASRQTHRASKQSDQSRLYALFEITTEKEKRAAEDAVKEVLLNIPLLFPPTQADEDNKPDAQASAKEET